MIGISFFIRFFNRSARYKKTACDDHHRLFKLVYKHPAKARAAHFFKNAVPVKAPGKRGVRYPMRGMVELSWGVCGRSSSPCHSDSKKRPF